MNYKPLPVGVDNFKKLIEQDYYYVDKTLFIKELIDFKGEVNLFTRPRRFGKTLNMSMIQTFFEDNGNEETNKINKKLFKGLKIIDSGDKYTSHMCKYPVITISMKSAKLNTFQMAYDALRVMVIEEYARHNHIINSTKLTIRQKETFTKISNTGIISDSELYNSIKFLSECLYQHFNEKVIILIDEYDVPLETAYQNNFYDDMINFIRSFLERALKTNTNLHFAVVTGCLRISKESIFTGLNNFEAISILSKSYSEHYGFTETEIDEIISFYGFQDKKATIQDWYNGYVFGNTVVYNPWSLINYIKSIYIFKDEFPKPYWSNTSSNSIVKNLIEKNTIDIKDTIEGLIHGESIEIPVHEEVTYGDMESNDLNIWNFLFFTGYLKKVSERFEGKTTYIEAKIPNKEVEYIYENTVKNWFDGIIKVKDLTHLYKALFKKDEEALSNIISEELMDTISYNDYKESFYHGILVGLFSKMDYYRALSNHESGLGRPDILLRPRTVRKEAILIEVKISKNIDTMESDCFKALKQIEEKKYTEYLWKDGFRKFIKFGVSFYKKECMFKLGK